MIVFAGTVLADNYAVWWIAQAAAIAILIALILRWRPSFLGGKTIGETMSAALDSRKALVEEQLALAERNRQEAERLRAEAQADIERATEEAKKIVAGAAHTSEAIRDEIVQRAREEATRIKAQASAEIEQERARAVQALQRRAADIVIDAAGQIIERNLDQHGDQQLINTSLRQIGEQR